MGPHLVTGLLASVFLCIKRWFSGLVVLTSHLDGSLLVSIFLCKEKQEKKERVVLRTEPH